MSEKLRNGKNEATVLSEEKKNKKNPKSMFELMSIISDYFIWCARGGFFLYQHRADETT